MVQIVYNYAVEPQTRRNLSPTFVRRAVSRGVGKAATKIARIWRIESKVLCPSRTGRLRRSLTTVRTRIRKRGGIDAYQIEIGPRGILKGGSRDEFYFYILISPWGQRRLGTDHSFIEAAFRRHESRFAQIIRDEIWLSLRQAWSQRTSARFPLPQPGVTTEVT